MAMTGIQATKVLGDAAVTRWLHTRSDSQLTAWAMAYAGPVGVDGPEFVDALKKALNMGMRPQADEAVDASGTPDAIGRPGVENKAFPEAYMKPAKKLGETAASRGLVGRDLAELNAAMGVQAASRMPHRDPVSGALVIPTVTPTKVRAELARKEGGR